MAELTNKGQRSRVEAYELASANERTGASLLVSGDVKIMNNALAGIENGTVLNESQSAEHPIRPVVSWYQTQDGHTILTASVELEQAEAAIPAIRAFVEAVEAKYTALEAGKGAEV